VTTIILEGYQSSPVRSCTAHAPSPIHTRLSEYIDGSRGGVDSPSLPTSPSTRYLERLTDSLLKNLARDPAVCVCQCKLWYISFFFFLIHMFVFRLSD